MLNQGISLTKRSSIKAMQVDNSRIFRLVDIVRRFAALLAVLFLVVLMFYKYLYAQGITDSASMSPMMLRAGIAVCLAAVILFVYTSFIGLSYFSYCRREGVILIKYYDAKLFGIKRKKIMMPEKELAAIELKRYFGGLQKELILTRREQRGTAIYPPVNLSFVSTKVINSVMKDLNLLIS